MNTTPEQKARYKETARVKHANRTDAQIEADRERGRERHRKANPNYMSNADRKVARDEKERIAQNAPWAEEHTTYKGVTSFNDI
jgi:hypothetical protein